MLVSSIIKSKVNEETARCNRCGASAYHYSYATWENVCCKHYYAGCDC